MFDFASAKALVRQVVQSTFGVQAFYSDDSVDAPIEIRARWHNQLSRPFGDLENGGYAEVIEGIDRIVLIPNDVDGYPVTLQRGGIVTFPTMLPGVEFILDIREPASGPLEEAWTVTRK
jgi:hypothetical protein